MRDEFLAIVAARGQVEREALRSFPARQRAHAIMGLELSGHLRECGISAAVGIHVSLMGDVNGPG